MCKKSICLISMFLVVGLIQTSAVAAPGDLLLPVPNPTPQPENPYYNYFGYSVAAVGSNILVGDPMDHYQSIVSSYR